MPMISVPPDPFVSLAASSYPLLDPGSAVAAPDAASSFLSLPPQATTNTSSIAPSRGSGTFHDFINILLTDSPGSGWPAEMATAGPGGWGWGLAGRRYRCLGETVDQGAAGAVALTEQPHRREGPATHRLHVPAARRKGAAARQACEVRWRTGDRLRSLRLTGANVGLQQPPGVRVLWVVDHLACAAGLDDPARVHHGDVIGQFC